MGFLLGIASAMLYTLGSIFSRIGQRTRPTDDGLLVTNFVNAVLLGVCALFITWEPWHLTGFIALLGGGLFGTVFGRFLWLRGIRLVGPTRANAFSVATPIPTAITAWIFLGEGLSPWEIVGGAITIVGLLQIIRSRSSDPTNTPAPLRSYLIAALAPVSFGLALFLRKWGLERLPGAVTGAFIGSGGGIVALTLWEAGRGRLRGLGRRTIADPPWAFIGAGVVLGFAVLTQFWALGRIDAWVVAILGGTVAVWTPFMSMALLKRDEIITAQLLRNIGIVFVGIVVIAVV